MPIFNRFIFFAHKSPLIIISLPRFSHVSIKLLHVKTSENWNKMKNNDAKRKSSATFTNWRFTDEFIKDFFSLGNMRFVKVENVDKSPRIDVRIHFYEEGQLKPSKIGLVLNLNEYEKFKRIIPKIDKIVARISVELPNKILTDSVNPYFCLFMAFCGQTTLKLSLFGFNQCNFVASSALFEQNIPVITKPTKWLRKEEFTRLKKARLLEEYMEKYGVNPHKNRVAIRCFKKEFNHYDGQKYPKQQMPLNPSFNRDGILQKFADFPDILHSQIVQNLIDCGFSLPTAIQNRIFPVFPSGKHLFISAETGSGKSVAFAAPMISDLIWEKKANNQRVKALLVVPEIELSRQLFQVLTSLVFRTDMLVSLFDIQLDHANGGNWKELFDSSDILVTTVKSAVRLLEKAEISNCLNDRIRYLVIDEADMLLNDRFLPIMNRLFQHVTVGTMDELDRRIIGTRLLLLSSTFPTCLPSIVSSLLTNPSDLYYVTSGHLHRLPPHIRQTFLRIREVDKLDKLVALLGENSRERKPQTLVFCKDLNRVHTVSSHLTSLGRDTAILSKNDQNIQRTEQFARFLTGETDVLLCTDIAGRGLDTLHVSHVINFDMPANISDYMHRIGRVGRVGAFFPGNVTNFVRTFADVQLTKIIEVCLEMDYILRLEAVRKDRLLSDDNFDTGFE